jgi:hypothetical protein
VSSVTSHPRGHEQRRRPGLQQRLTRSHPRSHHRRSRGSLLAMTAAVAPPSLPGQTLRLEHVPMRGLAEARLGPPPITAREVEASCPRASQPAVVARATIRLVDSLDPGSTSRVSIVTTWPAVPPRSSSADRCRRAGRYNDRTRRAGTLSGAHGGRRISVLVGGQPAPVSSRLRCCDGEVA